MKRAREWVFFFFSCIFLFVSSAFCNLFFYKLKIWWWPNGISFHVTLSLQLFSLWEMGLCEKRAFMAWWDLVMTVCIYFLFFSCEKQAFMAWWDLVMAVCLFFFFFFSQMRKQYYIIYYYYLGALISGCFRW